MLGYGVPVPPRCLMNIFKLQNHHVAALCAPKLRELWWVWLCEEEVCRLWVRCLPSQRCGKWRSELRLGHVPCPASPRFL